MRESLLHLKKSVRPRIINDFEDAAKRSHARWSAGLWSTTSMRHGEGHSNSPELEERSPVACMPCWARH